MSYIYIMYMYPYYIESACIYYRSHMHIKYISATHSQIHTHTRTDCIIYI